MAAYNVKLEQIADGFGLTVEQMLEKIADGWLVVKHFDEDNHEEPYDEAEDEAEDSITRLLIQKLMEPRISNED